MPPALRGTLYRNGPAVFDAGVEPHWFDGNGAVAAVRLDGAGAAGAVRVLHAPSADHDAGRRDTRYGGFRQPASRAQRLRALLGARPIRNTANINVLPWQGRLFALYETTLPLEIDPQSLTTIGETDLDGVIPGGWNAHPHYVPARRTTYHIGLRTGAAVHLDVFALPDRGPASRMTSLRLPGLMEVHDFFATENHLVIVLPPLWGHPLRMIWSGSFVRSLDWHAGAATEIVVIPIDRPEQAWRLQTEPFFFWHAANAYEDGARIVLDLVRYPDFSGVREWLERVPAGEESRPSGGTFWRGEIDLAARRARWEERWPRSCEFPMVHPQRLARRHGHAWVAAYASEASAGGWWDRLVRLDLERAEAIEIDPGPKRAVGEPVLVQKSDAEHDAWVLALVRDLSAGATHLAIWDGARPRDDAVARLWFDQQLPPSLHGAWVPAR